MSSKIVVGPITKGLRTDVTPFNIDNDAFPTLINAYQWRGRVKRKRGTGALSRLRRFFNSLNTAYGATSTITLAGGNGNLITGFSLESTSSIAPGSVTITVGAHVYTDPTKDGYLTPTGTSGPNTINYATGAIVIPGEAGNAASASFNYYPGLPVLGLETFVLLNNPFPGQIAFDTKYAYNILTVQANSLTYPFPSYDVSFYKNPAATAFLPGYVPKSIETPTTWNGQNYQQFWSTNYQNALWVTNGIPNPFVITNISMQYGVITNVVIIPPGTPPASVTLTIPGHGLVVGDFVYINEVQGNTGINFQTGYVTVVVDANNVTIVLPYATVGGAYSTGGIAQYLTNRSDKTKDCLRFYDGDPTNGNITTPALTGVQGWVNFAPPLSLSTYSISELPQAQYYLVGARMIRQFKDRLLFFGPVVQTSAAGSQIYLQDTIIYNQNGSPYYTTSFTGADPASAGVTFNSILLPTNQSTVAGAYFEDIVGFGGFIQVGLDQQLNTVEPNRDVLIIGFDKAQVQVLYTGNDASPFSFYIVNSDLGSSSTFGTTPMDKGVLSRGNQGFVITNPNGAERFDLDIPDSVFETRLINNGTERLCSQRDFQNEWIYFTYPSNSDEDVFVFPNQTLLYNYRDHSWAVFYETYTTYGTFRVQSGFTWQTVGFIFPTWSAWNEPWNSGFATLEQSLVIAGNQQGYVMMRTNGTGEANSLWIQSISGSTVTSLAHGLNDGDFIQINNALGTVGAQVNGNVFKVSLMDQNSFTLNPNIAGGTYLGLGEITRFYVPFIQSKQFPTAWGMGRKTRIGAQQYLLTTTANSQITLLIYLSQNESQPYNLGAIVPDLNSVNNTLIYSTVLYTCPESQNLGLTPANVNLQMPTANQQAQTWHRINTSLIGDTVQVGFTISDDQMTLPAGQRLTNQIAEVELHGFLIDASPSQLLS